MSRHLSAYSQYSRQAAVLSGRFHSAPQAVQTVLSSSLQISKSLPHTWHFMYDGLGWRRSRRPGHVCGFFSMGLLSLELNYFAPNFYFVLFNWDMLARCLKRFVDCPLQASAAGDFHMGNCNAGNVVLFEDLSE